MTVAAPAGGFISSRRLGMSSREMSLRARAFWGTDLMDGDPIPDLRKAQAVAQEKYFEYLQKDPRASIIFPLVDFVDPLWIRKAVFDPTYGIQGLKDDLRKTQEKFTEEAAEIQKAWTSSTNLLHTAYDSDVTMLFKKLYPLQALIPREGNRGKIAAWDAIPPNGAGDAYFGAEIPVLQESEMIDYTRTATCKIMYADGRVTKMAQIAAGSTVPSRDLMSIRTMAAQEMMKNLRERSIIGVTRNVKATANSYVDAGPLEYAGLYELLHNNTGDPNYVTCGASVDTYEELEPYIEQTFNNMIQDGLMPDLICCDYKTFFMIRKYLNEFFRTESLRDTEFGISKLTLAFPGGLLPVVPIQFMNVQAGTNGAMFMLDTQYLAVRQLWTETMEELANVDTTQRFVITASEVLIDKTDVDGSSSLQGGVFGITLA